MTTEGGQLWGEKLPRDFYLRDCVEVAKDLLGKILVTRVCSQTDSGPSEVWTAGKIVETEAYCGKEDKAAHSYKASPFGRTNVMYEEGGCAYIYLIYGMHYCFNIVAREKGVPHAVLIRALEPLLGLPEMRRRRNQKDDKNLCSGPGKLCKALGIEKSHYGELLTGDRIFLAEPEPMETHPLKILATPRINIAYAEEAKDFPYRFIVADSPYLSVKRR